MASSSSSISSGAAPIDISILNPTTNLSTAGYSFLVFSYLDREIQEKQSKITEIFNFLSQEIQKKLSGTSLREVADISNIEMKKYSQVTQMAILYHKNEAERLFDKNDFENAIHHYLEMMKIHTSEILKNNMPVEEKLFKFKHINDIAQKYIDLGVFYKGFWANSILSNNLDDANCAYVKSIVSYRTTIDIYTSMLELNETIQAASSLIALDSQMKLY